MKNATLNATLMVSDMISSSPTVRSRAEGAMTLQRFVLYGVVIPWLFLVLLVTAILSSGALVEPDLIPVIPMNSDLLVGFRE
jgi:hypothetical protein